MASSWPGMSPHVEPVVEFWSAFHSKDEWELFSQGNTSVMICRTEMILNNEILGRGKVIILSG